MDEEQQPATEAPVTHKPLVASYLARITIRANSAPAPIPAPTNLAIEAIVKAAIEGEHGDLVDVHVSSERTDK